MAPKAPHALVTRRFGGGVGNRLKRLVSAILNCEHIHTDDPIYKEITALDLSQPTPGIDYRIFSGWRLDISDLFPEVKGRGISCFKLISEKEDHDQRNAIDYEYFGIPLKVRYKVSLAFQLMGMSREVEERVHKLRTILCQELSIGCHIRTWLPQNEEYNNRYFDLKKFEDEINRRTGNAQIYLATDNPAIERYFIDKYGARLICQSRLYSILDYRHVTMDPIEPMHRSLRETAVAAYVDMLLLGHCHSIIGTYLSSFTECSWWLGGAKQPIVII